jgi:hypothetical protein
MRNSWIGLSGVLGLAAMWGVGCDSSEKPGQRPLDSVEATATINQHIDKLVRGLADTSAQVDTTGGTSVATGSIETATGSSSGIDDVPRSTTRGLDKLLHKVAQEAKDHVFREEFVESKDGNQVIYKLDPGTACGSSSECLQKLTANPVRFAVTAYADDSLKVELLVGQDRHSPGSALLGASKLSLRADLAEILDVIRLFVDAEDMNDLPDKLDGVLDFSIEKLAENEFAVSASVVEKVDVVVGQAKGKRVAFTLQPSDPALQLTVNSATNTLGYTVNFAAADVQVAGAALCRDNSECGAKERNGTFSAHVAGCSLGFTVSKGAQEITFTNLGLGNDTSYIALDSDRLGALDINPKNGRKLSLTFKKTDGGTLVSFDPVLDIKLAIMLNKLSDTMRVDMPGWLADEIFEVMFGGAAKPSILVPDSSSDTSDQLKVVSGTLSFSESSLPSPVEISAGMCLGAMESENDNTPPFSLLMAEACR